jgi:hypothetical protein
MQIEGAIRNAAKKVRASLTSFFYHRDQKKEAMKALHVIQEYNSQKLTPKLRKIADEYSIDVFGSKRYSAWLYVYALVNGKFREGWIPNNFFGQWVRPRLNNGLMVVPDLKTFSNVVLRTEALPDVAYYIDGIFYNKEFSAVNINNLREKLSASNREVFVKKDHFGEGVGVTKIAIEELNEGNLQKIGNCVIQSSIKQHAFFEEIISGSVATVRIITVKGKSGRIDRRAAFLRLGRKDTAWVRAENSVRVAIVNQSGELDTFGYTPDWRRWLSHPDSGVSFEKRLIPKFKEAVEVCIGLHNKVPHFTMIGWDIAIRDNERIEVLEWNANISIKLSEATIGPCFLGLGWEKYKENTRASPFRSRAR